MTRKLKVSRRQERKFGLNMIKICACVCVCNYQCNRFKFNGFESDIEELTNIVLGKLTCWYIVEGVAKEEEQENKKKILLFLLCLQWKLHKIYFVSWQSSLKVWKHRHWRDYSAEEFLLFLKKTQGQFPDHMWWFIVACNSSPRWSNDLTSWGTAHPYKAQIHMQAKYSYT